MFENGAKHSIGARPKHALRDVPLRFGGFFHSDVRYGSPFILSETNHIRDNRIGQAALSGLSREVKPRRGLRNSLIHSLPYWKQYRAESSLRFCTGRTSRDEPRARSTERELYPTLDKHDPHSRGNDRLTLNIGEDAGAATPAAVVTLHCKFDPDSWRTSLVCAKASSPSSLLTG